MALATATIIAGIGLAVGLAGAGVSAYGTMQQAKATEKAEKLREQQMNLDATRRRRETIRQMIISQAVGRSNAATQGATGGDSAVLGAQAQQTASAANNISAINQSQGIDQGIFKANREYAQGQVTSAWGGSISDIGNSIFQNSDKISRVGSGFGLWQSDIG